MTRPVPVSAVLTGPVPQTVLSVQTAARIADAVADAQAPGTTRAYASAWRRFEGWCSRSGHRALPAAPEVVAAYLVDAADTVDPESGERVYAPATMAKWLVAIADRHRRAGVEPVPTGSALVRATLAGIRRRYAAAGERPRVPRAPLLTDDIMGIVTAARGQVDGWAAAVHERRDSAILLLGFAGALRRSELAALTGGDVVLHPLDGLHLQLRRSKTDQEGRGAVVAVPRAADPVRCPPCAWVRWAQTVVAFDRGGRRAVIRLLTDPAPFDQGSGHVCRSSVSPCVAVRRPVFRSIRQNGLLSESALSGASVHAVIRRRAGRAGFDPAAVELLGGHSLRAGFVTQAFRAGADTHAIMRQTRHASPAMVERYARESAPLIGNAVTELGL